MSSQQRSESMGAAALLGALAANLIKARRTTRRKSQDLRTRVSGQNPFLGASGAAKAGSNRDAKAGSNREAVAEGRGGDTLFAFISPQHTCSRAHTRHRRRYTKRRNYISPLRYFVIREKKSFYCRESRKYTEIVHNRNVYIYSFVLWPCITHRTR